MNREKSLLFRFLCARENECDKNKMTTAEANKIKKNLLASSGVANSISTKKVLISVEKCCPTLYGIFKGTDPDGVFDMFSGDRDQTESHVFGFRIKAPNDGPMVECITHDVVKAGLKLANKNLKVYRELFENPPFPAWKDGLKELWN